MPPAPACRRRFTRSVTTLRLAGNDDHHLCLPGGHDHDRYVRYVARPAKRRRRATSTGPGARRPWPSALGRAASLRSLSSCGLPAETSGAKARKNYLKKVQEKLLVARGSAPPTCVGRGRQGTGLAPEGGGRTAPAPDPHGVGRNPRAEARGGPSPGPAGRPRGRRGRRGAGMLPGGQRTGTAPRMERDPAGPGLTPRGTAARDRLGPGSRSCRLGGGMAGNRAGAGNREDRMAARRLRGRRRGKAVSAEHGKAASPPVRAGAAPVDGPPAGKDRREPGRRRTGRRPGSLPAGGRGGRGEGRGVFAPALARVGPARYRAHGVGLFRRKERKHESTEFTGHGRH